VVRVATDFTLAPRGWSHAEAATITTAGLTAWRALVVDGQLKADRPADFKQSCQHQIDPSVLSVQWDEVGAFRRNSRARLDVRK